jgi:hypothetical protein
MIDKFYQLESSMMNHEDIRKLWPSIIGIGIFAIFLGIMTSWIIPLVFPLEDPALLIIPGFFSIFWGILVYYSSKLILDLRDREKKILKGIITDKTTMRSKRKKGTSKRSYFLKFDDLSFRVDRTSFFNFEKGDMMELHFAPRSKVVLRLKLLKSKALQL